ncbi:tRNA 5-methoxyuridine(34)/uridine 5-oxyacetic acid(34) synthase CmoB [Pseudomonas sp. F1_0610]|uniref:tRNA 5-methoxyuridine(34)/uridine 5-oxyacetic acid(34) synthase CmoB n=1 Tax=Pseudomonas sp. F1_0610 TaxID=3114284 RepID=UPI0039C10D31
MIDFSPLIAQLEDTPLATWAKQLPDQFAAKLAISHGDLPRWKAAVDALPEITPNHIDIINKVAIEGTTTADQDSQILSALQGLIPWRKGPFDVFKTHINTEWRSDWKWERVRQHIQLKGRRVLDVGCGNGYHMWRMLGDGARTVIGVDPNWLFFCQYLALKKYQPTANIWHLPFAFEELPEKLEGFDTVFSMGVLYHRKSPIDHLYALKEALCSRGELILETLVIEGDAQQVLVPDDRYSQMRNVWFLPSVEALALWLKRAGFVDIRCVDINVTSIEEQRATEWMKYQSLPDFLDPKDPSKTLEGLPAPTRAIFIARKP